MDFREYITDVEQVSIKGFASILGVHPNTLNNWLNGHFMPNAHMIGIIEEKTGGLVKYKDLMDLWEAKNKNG